MCHWRAGRRSRIHNRVRTRCGSSGCKLRHGADRCANGIIPRHDSQCVREPGRNLIQSAAAVRQRRRCYRLDWGSRWPGRRGGGRGDKGTVFVRILRVAHLRCTPVLVEFCAPLEVGLGAGNIRSRAGLRCPCVADAKNFGAEHIPKRTGAAWSRPGFRRSVLLWRSGNGGDQVVHWRCLSILLSSSSSASNLSSSTENLAVLRK
jgi:hypothetical protein